MTTRLHPHSIASHTRAAAILLSTALCLALSLCYALRPDACAALTLWPPWLWAPPGLALLLLGFRRVGKRPFLCILLLWLAYLLLFTEEPRTILRFGGISQADFDQVRNNGRALRVISLNCAGGAAAVAREVQPYHPDIILLQESPRPQDLEELAALLFGEHGSLVSTLDTSIIARGALAPPSPDLPPHFLQTHLRTPEGVEAALFSIRLQPPLLRPDLWSPQAWRAQRSNRRLHREEMQQVAARLQSLPKDLPIILGGDFNAPAGDAIFRLLSPRLHDTFPEGGRGLGNTVLNDFPILRFDQIWTSYHFRAARVRAHRTLGSDHRMVVSDLILRAADTAPIPPRTPTPEPSP